MSRSGEDSWNLASSVGATATLVAAARAVASRADPPLINDPYAEVLVRAVGVDFLARWASGETSAAEIEDGSAGWGLKHMPYVLAARTHFFDDFFVDAVKAGVRQAVILASGLDARAYRLFWPEGTIVFEIDQPQVMEFKRATMARVGATPTAQLKPLAIDLRADWVAALEDAGFDRTRPSAWIAEGLLAYLPPDAQDALLGNVSAVSAPGSVLAVEAFPSGSPDDEARASMRQMADIWRRHGLDVDFAALTFDGKRHDVPQFLDDRGWDTEAVAMSSLLAQWGYPPFPSATDDTATFSEVYCTTSYKRG